MVDFTEPGRSFESPYGNIAYEVFGEGPPLVFVHGTPFSSFVWRYFIPTLAENHQVFVFDLLGYGQSEQCEGQDVSLAVQPKVLKSLFAHWEIERPTVVAHDFGGTTALRAHLLETCDYKHLILMDPVALSPWGSPFVQHVRQHFDAFASVPSYIHSGILDAYIQDAAYHPLDAQVLDRLKAPWMGATGQPAFYRQIAQMDQKYTDELAALFGEIRCPVDIIWGQEDTWIPVEKGHQLQEAIPNSTLTRIPQAAHLVQEDQPQRLLEELETLTA